MKLSKTFGRVATTLVATAMLASLAAPAYALEEGAYKVENNQITIKKELVMPKDVVTPGETFVFDIKPVNVAETEETEEVTIDDVNFDVKSGEGQIIGNAEKNINIATTTPGDDDTVSGNNKTVTVDAVLTLPSTFTDAGVYMYTIDEQTVNATDGYIDHTGSLDLYLIVERTDDNNTPDNFTDDKYGVTGAVVYGMNADGSGKEKTDKYINYYMLDESGESKVGTITIGKEIAGTMASPNDEFTFEISGLDMNKSYSTSDPNVTLGKIDDKTTVNTVTLRAGDRLTINGVEVSDGFDYAITEKPNEKGYTLTNIAADEGDDDLVKVNKNEDTFVNASVKVEKSGDSGVTFTNTRDAVSPTGLVMDIAPYALLVVVAAGACFFFVRKRRED